MEGVAVTPELVVATVLVVVLAGLVWMSAGEADCVCPDCGGDAEPTAGGVRCPGCGDRTVASGG